MKRAHDSLGSPGTPGRFRPMPRLPSVILASASPRRRELLAQLGIEFDVVPGNAAEVERGPLTAREVCLLNAHRKARVIAKRHPDHLVIGADTVVALGTRLFGKPRDAADAMAMLGRLSGRTHEVFTGVCLLHLRRHSERLFAELTQVTFRTLTDVAIHAYVTAVNTLDKAGGYAIQERGGDIIANIVGSYSNVVGLPIEVLGAELAAWPPG